MSDLKIYLPVDLDTRFRKIAMNKFGYGRGSLSKAATEAILQWCNDKDAQSTIPETQKATTGGEKEPIEAKLVESKRELPQETSVTKDSSNGVASGT